MGGRGGEGLASKLHLVEAFDSIRSVHLNLILFHAMLFHAILKLAGWLVGLLAGKLAGWLAGWLVGWLVGWLAG